MKTISLLILFFWFAIGTLHAQQSIPVGRGTEFPVLSGVEGGWFYHEELKGIYWWNGSIWKSVHNEAYTEIKVCHEFLFARRKESIDVYYAKHGRLLSHDAYGMFCSDSLEGFWSIARSMFQNTQGDLLTHYNGDYFGCIRGFQSQFVQGMEAFCLPRTFIGDDDFECKDIHTWGLLGSNGRWLVTPEYDEPFEFRNGMAEAKKYGKAIKINEKGEVVGE